MALYLICFDRRTRNDYLGYRNTAVTLQRLLFSEVQVYTYIW